MDEKYVYQPHEKRNRIKAIAGAASGNLVEWFDFYIFAAFAIYFQHALTPPDMPAATKEIYVWGVFALPVSLCAPLVAGSLVGSVTNMGVDAR